MEKYYSPDELAEILHVHPTTIRNLIKKGKLRAVDVGCNVRPTWKISDGSYLAFLAESHDKITKISNFKPNVNDIEECNKETIKNLISTLVTKDKNDCWLWNRNVDNRGYGFMSIPINGKNYSFGCNRISHVLWKGKIPDGKKILHKCHNPPCCNPDHLYIGDDKQNAKDRVERKLGIDHLNGSRPD